MSTAVEDPVTPTTGGDGGERGVGAAAPGRNGGRLPVWVWALPAVAALAVTAPWIDRTALWEDELATLSAATRSWSDLGRLVRTVDGVHATYYGLMHVWTAVFGTSAVSLRLPSVLATAAAAALLAVLGARLAGRRAGLVAGLLLAVVPSVSQYADDARPYALVLAVAVGATLALVDAVDRPGRWLWVRYAALVALLGALQVTATLLVLAHACVVATGALGTGVVGTGVGRPRGVRPRAAAGFVAALGAACVVVLPVAVLGSRQQAQIAWIRPPTPGRLLELPPGLFVSASVMAAVLGAAATVVLRAGPVRRVAVPWALVPAVALVALSFTVVPLTSPRYLLFALPGWLLVAATATTDRRSAVALVALVLVLGLPAQTRLRGDVWYDQPDYRRVAAILDDRARPGDAIAMTAWAPLRYRIGLRAYLSPRTRLDDVFAGEPAAAAATLDDLPCTPAADCLGTPARLWIGCWRGCGDPLAALARDQAAAVRAVGYRRVEVWPVPADGSLTLWTR
ncbi:glycosyltransferase family 39 protein [Kineosporia sp. A_224]|uniref:glycosyltransferase family 39 protein n=1 Tax=Kineosporia sp. A_224 TaxID=1962180 RepID=UPI000B4B5492|nr:glycosyltransferase family 39 protein [Kineosporia sp. A_224]